MNDVSGHSEMKQSPSTTALAAEIERVEGEAWAELQLCLPPVEQRRLGVSVVRLHGAVLLIASRTAEVTINRVVGLGFGAPLTAAVLDDVIDAYSGAGVKRFILQWSPVASPASVPDLLAKRGFTVVSHIAKVFRAAGSEPPESADEQVVVREVGPRDAEAFEEIVAAPLGVPHGMGAGVRSTIGQPRWRYYLAFDDDRPIAGAALYVDGEHGWCGFGATLESHRRRGAQTALLRRRLHDAAECGCAWVSADTLVGKRPGSIQSQRNLLRVGFQLLYERPNYLFDFERA